MYSGHGFAARTGLDLVQTRPQDSPTMQFDTLAVHAAAQVDPATGAVMPAIHTSTTFERAVDGGYPSGFVYVRSGNPNRASLEAALAALEGGGDAVAFASGMAATNAVLQALRPGDHVIAPLDAYFGTPRLLREHFAPWGLELAFVDRPTPPRSRRPFGPIRACSGPNPRRTR
jgi:cystathionine gamma-synthase